MTRGIPEKIYDVYFSIDGNVSSIQTEVCNIKIQITGQRNRNLFFKMMDNIVKNTRINTLRDKNENL